VTIERIQMPPIPKHEPTKSKRNGAKKPQQAAAETVMNVIATGPKSKWTGEDGSMQHDINHVAGLSGIEQSLDCLVDVVARLTHDDRAVTLSVSQGSNTNPVQLTLSGNDYDDTMGRLVDAVERIADSIAKLAGLSRPRLESWHEQDSYVPRYRDIACDGGAPGPAQTKPT
jgi:hypothetical protein